MMRELLTCLMFLIIVTSCNEKKDKSNIQGTWNFEAGDAHYMNYNEGVTKSVKYSFDNNQLYILSIDTIMGIELKNKDIYFYDWQSDNVMVLNRVLPVCIVDTPYVKSNMNIYIKITKNNNTELKFLMFDDIAGAEHSPVYSLTKENDKKPKIKRKDLWDYCNNIAKEKISQK